VDGGAVESLSINPSNQGLKLTNFSVEYAGDDVSIHQSIKSRVETSGRWQGRAPLRSLYPSIHQIKG